MIDLTGKTAFITGAARGIGFGCAERLVQAGANVIINDVDQRALEKAGSTLMRKDHPCLTILGDMFNDVDRPETVAEVLLHWDVDILVSNPYFSIQKPLLEWGVDEFRNVLEGVLVSHFAVAQEVARQMVSNNTQGSIIFISSVYGSLNRENSIGYDTGKAGINQMVKVFARELAGHGIRANAIAPGFTDTPGEHKFASAEELEAVGADLPLGCACQPEDIGNTAVFLASEMARMITVQVITVDGGMSLCDFSYERPSLKTGEEG